MSDDLALESALVRDVTGCRSCTFFWPERNATLPYGPYTAYDFAGDTPHAQTDDPRSPWMKVKTVEPAFPDPEVMDGCRKAPIMTVGINPNLTAFAPGRMGTSWCYPKFSSDEHTNALRKNAYYYRYRSIYQERLAFEEMQRFALPDGRITAEGNGTVVSATRLDDSPSYALAVRYDGHAKDTSITLHAKLGEPQYALFVDPAPPYNTFKRGDLLAAKIDVPAGLEVAVFAQPISYYNRFRKPLEALQALLHRGGHSDAALRIGEDVGQLDMVACASPHWSPAWLGRSHESVMKIIHNCVSHNAWALKQLLHTRPALLVLVGQASYDMFHYAFGHFLQRQTPLPAKPEDGAFTLLRETADAAHPCTFEFSTTVHGKPYRLTTRVVVAPHFSYAINYLPQYRLEASAWAEFSKRFHDCARFLGSSSDVAIVAPAPPATFTAVQLKGDAGQMRHELARRFPDATALLEKGFYDPDAMLASVLSQLYERGALQYVAGKNGKRGYLQRTDGPCTFCEVWQFPEGCPYGKPAEPQYPAGYLDAVAAKLLDESDRWRQTHAEIAERAIVDSPFRGFPSPTD